jgi:hypothetical protein
VRAEHEPRVYVGTAAANNAATQFRRRGICRFTPWSASEIPPRDIPSTRSGTIRYRDSPPTLLFMRSPAAPSMGFLGVRGIGGARAVPRGERAHQAMSSTSIRAFDYLRRSLDPFVPHSASTTRSYSPLPLHRSCLTSRAAGASFRTHCTILASALILWRPSR